MTKILLFLRSFVWTSLFSAAAIIICIISAVLDLATISTAAGLIAIALALLAPRG
jgi:hypothetical protein